MAKLCGIILEVSPDLQKSQNQQNDHKRNIHPAPYRFVPRKFIPAYGAFGAVVGYLHGAGRAFPFFHGLKIVFFGWLSVLYHLPDKIPAIVLYLIGVRYGSRHNT